MVALDKMTGKEIWRTAASNLGAKGKDGAGYSSVVISNAAGVKQYVQLMGRGLVGVRASDGKLLWSYNKVANDVANISTPVVAGDYVFASTGYGTGSALLKLAAAGGGVTATEVYFLDPKVFQNHHGGFVLVGDHIYAGHGHNKGFPICLELATGKVVWGGDIRNEGTGSAAVVYADGNLVFRYQNGVVILVEATPTGYKEKGSFTIPNPNTLELAAPRGRRRKDVSPRAGHPVRLRREGLASVAPEPGAHAARLRAPSLQLFRNASRSRVTRSRSVTSRPCETPSYSTSRAWRMPAAAWRPVRSMGTGLSPVPCSTSVGTSMPASSGRKSAWPNASTLPTSARRPARIACCHDQSSTACVTLKVPGAATS